MKQCIWCNRKEHDTSFKTLAHTFPQSIGGKKICKNVCDECNFAFGRKQQFQPSVDIAVKEIFNISKNIISTNPKQFQKNRFKSEYFKIDIEKRKITLKPKYKLKSNFQETFARSFRRGIYKIFLEERERIIGDALSDEFNFIREFSRYNLNDIPLYYLKPVIPLIFTNEEHLNNPELQFSTHNMNLHEEYRLFDFYYAGYSYLLHTNNFMKDFHIYNYNINVINKETNSMKLSKIVAINRMEDLDFRYQLFNQK